MTQEVFEVTCLVMQDVSDNWHGIDGLEWRVIAGLRMVEVVEARFGEVCGALSLGALLRSRHQRFPRRVENHPQTPHYSSSTAVLIYPLSHTYRNMERSPLAALHVAKPGSAAFLYETLDIAR